MCIHVNTSDVGLSGRVFCIQILLRSHFMIQSKVNMDLSHQSICHEKKETQILQIAYAVSYYHRS